MAADAKVDLEQWEPKQLLAFAKAQTLPEFLMRCEATFMMIVMIDPGDEELAQGLSREPVSERTGPEPRTVSSDDSRPLPLAQSGQKRQARAFAEETCERLPLAFARKGCHVVPLVKRSHGTTHSQISVGRGRDHDVVLRHRTVSKMHALFELTQEVRLMLSDCQSSNHTYLNGKRVQTRAEVRPGDTLKFGAVEARICTSEGFWRLVHG